MMLFEQGLSAQDWAAIGLSLKLASTVTVLLLLISTPIAWWLANTRSPFRGVVSSVVALPLVLPPSVLGFYLLIAMGPQGPIGQFADWLGLAPLVFSFKGLVIASVLYSLPFVVQPIENAIVAVGRKPVDTAATLRAGPIDSFFSVVLPQARHGFITASVLGFAHTLGEFGVVLMIGGNIPQQTQVISVQIYEHVEALEYANAHALSALMLTFSFVVLLALYTLQSRNTALFRPRSP